jgi:hypothetical protein
MLTLPRHGYLRIFACAAEAGPECLLLVESLIRWARLRTVESSPAQAGNKFARENAREELFTENQHEVKEERELEGLKRLMLQTNPQSEPYMSQPG